MSLMPHRNLNNINRFLKFFVNVHITFLPSASLGSVGFEMVSYKFSFSILEFKLISPSNINWGPVPPPLLLHFLIIVS